MTMRWTCAILLIGAVFSAVVSGAEFRNAFDVQKGNLVDKGSNPYMILDPGHKLVLADGKDTLTITVLDETKVVDGVATRIVEERETKEGRLEEVSRNYFALDKVTGDIYYFGENVDIYDAKGDVASHEGSWVAGVNGARFGLMLPGKPRVGERYYQEMSPGVAMDRAEIVSLTQKVKVPAGRFEGCLKIRESSDLEGGTEEKLYAPGVGLLKDGGFQLAKVEIAARQMNVPDVVMTTFTAVFPKGQIEKVDAEEENGAVVYDFEFKDGRTEKETDITADGTMLEFSVMVRARNVPRAAMKTVRNAAEGAKIGRIERVEIGYELREGKVVKLESPVIHYEIEMTRGDQRTEIVVDADGLVVDPPKWDGGDKD